MKKQSKAIYLQMVFLLILSLIFYGNILAQTSPLWGNLEKGQYDVGFKTIEKYDYSRTFRSRYDYFGEPLPGENARPIQICIWYPAQKSADNLYMVLGEYAFPMPENPDFFQIISATQQRELMRLTGMLGNDRGNMLDASNIEVGAIRDAEAAEGKFPLLVYFPGLASGISDNFILCEYLASHGYVIITTHQIGTTAINPELTNIDLETIIRDKEFALANIRDIGFIDREKIGTFGPGSGGLAALFLQMRNFNIEAVAGLAGWNIRAERAEFVNQNQNFVINRMSRPMLQIYYESAELFDLSLLDSLKYSDRYLLKLPDNPFAGYTSYPAIVSYMDSTNTSKTITHPNYDLIGSYLLNFFDGLLIGNESGLAFLTNAIGGEVSFELRKGMELPPTSNQFIAIIQSQGGQNAIDLYNKFEETDPGSITFPEATVNFLAYQAMQRGQNNDALALFKLNAETFPNSANVWDSYSDGYQSIGDSAKAVQCYKKVLEVLKTDSTTNSDLRETLRTNAETGIERLSTENN